MSVHVAIALTANGIIETIEVPTEEPLDDEVLVKVEYTAVIPPEVYMEMFTESYPYIMGFTTAGTVMKVGNNVEYFKPNDRVTTYASVCAKIPDTLSFEAAATIPDNFVCAFYTLFNQLSLPMPSSFPASEDPLLADTPILIYGAGTTAGQYIIRLLHLARYNNIIVTASTMHHEYLRSLGATHVFDYHSPTLIEDLNKAAGGPNKLTVAVDCISAINTMSNIKDVLNPTGTVALLMPVKEGFSLNVDKGKDMILDLPLPTKLNPFEKETNIIGVRTFFYQADSVLKEKLMPVILPELLEKGLIGQTRYRVLDQGNLLQRAKQALELHRANQVRGEKVIVKID